METQYIKLPEPIRVKNIHHKLDILTQNNVIKRWFGHNYIDTLFYLYLFNKYKHNCLVKYQGLIQGLSNDFVGLELIITGNIKVPIEEVMISEKHIRQIALQLMSCIKKGANSVIIPLYLKFYKSSKIELNNMIAHANVLIYRKKDNVIEHFEPHGSHFGSFNPKLQQYINDKLDDFISILNEAVPEQSHIRLIKSNEVCPFFNGFQKLEENSLIPKLEIQGHGYCAAWSLFFAELALKNPNCSSNELINIIYDKLNKLSESDRNTYLRKIIVGYVSLIHDKVEKYFSIVFGKHINIDTIIRIYNERKDASIFYSMQTMIDIETALLNTPSLTKEQYVQYIKLKINKTTNIPEKNRLIAQDKMLENIDILLNSSPISEEYKSISKSKSKSSLTKSESSAKKSNPNKNEETIRCENKKLKPCSEKQFRNPITCRCTNIKPTRKINTTRKRKICEPEKLSPCSNNRERNNITCRCRKIKVL